MTHPTAPKDTAAPEALPLAGRHALVTGAGSGIGAAIALALARQGATLTLLGRRHGPLATVCASLPSPPSGTMRGPGHGIVSADLCDPTGLAGALQALRHDRGPVDILVNNAGAARSAPLHRSDAALWDEMIAVNLSGPFHTTRAVLPDMLAAGWGRIINIASTAGLRGYAYVAPYCAAKHGLIGLTRALALEVAQRGITVNAVCPGYTDTPLLEGALEQITAKTGRSAGQARSDLAASNPQGRLVQPEEVAHSVVWLCLPGTESVHGQSLALAGGEVM